MADIYAGFAVLLAGSLLSFLISSLISRNKSKSQLNAMALLLVVLTISYEVLLQESVFLSKLMPFSNLMVIGNWFPVLGAALCGIAWHAVPGRQWRKLLSICLLITVSVYSMCERFMGRVPDTSDYWRNGVCLQTSASSCSAACAATLLSGHGIKSNETEMAQLCFTRSGKGTTWYGLYRGLKLKTAGTSYDAELFKWDLQQLQSRLSAPVILSVRLDKRPGIDPRYEQKWGWTPGMQHAVILYEIRSDGRIVVGDPSVGREFWSIAALTELWHGEGARLVPRND